jgi:plasmid stabilization system protein ParE
MSYRHIYDPVALKEYTEALIWYLEKSERVAINFVAEVKEKIAVICKEPLRFRNIYKKYRETSLKKYPYSIVYLVDEERKMIVISSVYHHKRNPRKKYRK